MAVTLPVLALATLITIDESFSPVQVSLTGSAVTILGFLAVLLTFIPTRFKEEALASS